MDFKAQQDFLSELLGDPNTSADDAFPLARRLVAINRGELQFSVDAKCLKEYVTGTVSDNVISLPSDWLETAVLVIDNNNITSKREMALENWERHYQGGEDDPIYYVWEFSGTKQIRLMSSAGYGSGTYQLWYYKKPIVDLSADGDESILPDEFREASVYWGAHRMFQQIGKNELSNRMMEQYSLIVQRAMQQCGKETIENQQAVPDMGDKGYSSSTTDHQGQGFLY